MKKTAIVILLLLTLVTPIFAEGTVAAEESDGSAALGMYYIVGKFNMIGLSYHQWFGDHALMVSAGVQSEQMSVLDYMIPLEKNQDQEMLMDIGHYDDDYPQGVGDRILYSPQFQPGRKFYLGYKPCHKYDEWAASLPEKTPKLKGFDITKA